MRIETEGSGYAERRPEPSRPTDGRLAALVDRLHRAQQRSFYGALLAGGAVSILIGLGAFCILQLAYALSGGLGSAAADPVQAAIPQNIVIAVTLAVACAALTWFYAVRGKPWLTSMARAADSRFRLEETMSTALEIVAAPAYAGTGVVGDALLKRAEARTSSVNAQSLTPMRLPAGAWIAFPLLVAVAIWLVLAPPPPVLQNVFDGGGLFGGPATADITDPERVATAADLHAIAAIMRQDGEIRADAAVQAIARQLDIVANNLETNPNATRDQVGAEIERLRDLAAAAYAQNGAGAAAARSLLNAIQNTLGQFDPARVAANPATEVGTGAPPGNATPGANNMDAPFDAVVIHDEGGFDPAGEGLPMPGLGVNPNQINQTNNGAPGNWAEATAPMETPLDDEYGPYGPEGPGGDTPGAAGGELAGAAEGAGDIAGIGGAALFGPDGRPLDPIAIAGQMLLQDRNRDGRRIQVNLPPLTELMDVDAGALDTGAWRNLIERQVNRTALPAADREVMMRYFEAMMREPTE